MKYLVLILSTLFFVSSASAYESWSLYDEGDWQVNAFQKDSGPISCKMWSGDLNGLLELSYVPEVGYRGIIHSWALDEMIMTDKVFMAFDDQLYLPIIVARTPNEITWLMDPQDAEYLMVKMLNVEKLVLHYNDTGDSFQEFSSEGLIDALLSFESCAQKVISSPKT